MWTVAFAVLVVVVGIFALWWAGGSRFDFVQIWALTIYARLWHGYKRPNPAPVPCDGALLLVANHAFHADPALLMAGSRRVLHFLQARGNFDVPGLRWLFRRVHCIAVRRDGHDIGAVRTALHDLQQGAAIGIFPEGDVNPTGTDQLAPAHHGAAFLALHSNAIVVPAYIAHAPHTRNMLRAWFRPSRGVRVVFGPQVDLSAYRNGSPDRESVREVSDLLMARIAALRPSPHTVSMPVAASAQTATVQ